MFKFKALVFLVYEEKEKTNFHLLVIYSQGQHKPMECAQNTKAKTKYSMRKKQKKNKTNKKGKKVKNKK